MVIILVHITIMCMQTVIHIKCLYCMKQTTVKDKLYNVTLYRYCGRSSNLEWCVLTKHMCG